MGRALWRELVIGFASQLGEMRLGFTQLAALYVLADSGTMTIGDLAEVINRSPSATSRLIGSARAASAASNTAAAAGDVATKACPIPTDCDPWPGKTRAHVVIVVERSRSITLRASGRVRRCTETALSGYPPGR